MHTANFKICQEVFMSEWRDIWKKTIIACQNTVLEKDYSGKLFFSSLEKEYPNDKMINFEYGIAMETLKSFEEAKKAYKQASDELPVKHWRNVAELFLERLEEKIKQNGQYFINPSKSRAQIQWDAFYNMHSYIYLDSQIQYLAISSISRIDSEPEMAIAIFRICIEMALYFLFEDEINPKGKTLDEYLKALKDFRKISKEEYSYYDFIKDEGNIAVHPNKKKNISAKQYSRLSSKEKDELKDIRNKKPFKYTESEIIEIIVKFNESMNLLNEQFKLQKQ